MAHWIKKPTVLLLRFLLSLRYRIDLVGVDSVKGLDRALILPNHPAYIDPALVISSLWPALRPRPMLLARIFKNPLLFWIPKLMDALKVPALDRHSTQAREQAERSIDAVVKGLERGENFILWPSGRVQRRDREILGGTRSVAEIVSRVSDVNIVLVRTRGLRGSMFSFARTALTPNLTACLLKGVAILLANLIFFTPRRRVSITLKPVSRDSLPGPTREELNAYLEAWYNEPGPEPATFVPYHALFGPRSFEFPPLPTALSEGVLGEIKSETKQAIAEILEEKIKDDSVAALKDPATSLDSLGLDSLDRMEVSLAVEERFGFRGGEVPQTVGDLWTLAQGLAESAPPKPPPERWFEPPAKNGAAALMGSTLLEALVRRALACRGDVAAADDLSGVVTYERFLVGTQAMARQFERIPTDNVGILMPASVATDIVVFAVQLAGKLPVLLNWTTGPGNLARAATTMRLTHVVTSKRLIDRLALTVEGTRLVYLEEVRQSIGKLELVRLLLRTRFAPGAVLRSVPKVASDTPAVVLFTSGSEKAPKAVPLTHDNILSNLQGVLEAYPLKRSDTIFGFLPTFHSFGITLTSMLPLLSGCRVVHHPDPTDASALVRILTAYKVSIICATPTFLSHILNRIEESDLESLRWAVVGGEKCPDALFDEFSSLAPRSDLLEGYGITECSPLVCSNRPDKRKRGTIGAPIPGVEVKVLDPDSFEPLPNGELGMLLVSGRNVFPGYIAYDGPSPFHDFDGKRWYVTGDLAFVVDDGFCHFRGRMKRFLKAGGEMISLPAIEEPFALKYPPSDDGPRVAVEGIEVESGRQIVLFTTESIDLKEANALLMKEGFRGVMRLDEVRQVEEIPVLGTGKTDYKVLRGWLSEAMS